MRAWYQENCIWQETGSLSEALGLNDFNKGSIAVVGAGGKTSIIFKLAEEFAARCVKVVITTTTRMYREPGSLATTVEKAKRLLEHQSVVIAGLNAEEGKIAGLEEAERKGLTQIADIVLIEADGSKRKPLKVPASHEPVIPGGVDKIIVVAGLSGIGTKLSDSCHRAELAGELLDVATDHSIQSKDIVQMIRKGYLEQWKVNEIPVSVILNQADNEERCRVGIDIANMLVPYSCVVAKLIQE
jgi:probable selenium-dependent hydroxylase accessory protein YqeC